MPFVEHPQLTEAKAWSEAHEDLLARCYQRFAVAWQWPLLEQLQHDFELAGIDEDVAAIAWRIPKALGYVEQQHLVLLVRALAYVPAAQQLLVDWFAALRLAYERWRLDPTSELTRSDVAKLVAGDETRIRGVSEVLLRESWPFGGGTGGADEDWTRTLASGVRAVRDATCANDVIEARERIMFPPVEIPETPTSTASRRRLVWHSVVRAWQLVSHHPLWSAVIAAVIAAVLIKVLLGDSGSTTGQRQGSTQRPSAGIPGTSPQSAAASRGTPRREQAGNGGARTYLNPFTLTGEGVRISPDQYVTVLCRIYSPQPPSVVPDGFWYRIASPPWSGRYYAPANSFWNGDVPGRRPYTHNTDFRVPRC